MKAIAVLSGISASALVVLGIAVFNLANTTDHSNDNLTRASATALPSRQPSPSRVSNPTHATTLSPTGPVTETPQAVGDAPELYEERLAACGSRPNGSTVELVPTRRTFIMLPRNDYVLDGRLFVPVSGDASGGWISNAGLPGQAFGATDACWQTYYELDGEGQVDFRAKSARVGVPDYVLHFMVSEAYRPTPTPSSR
jgi:hypothetical protein